MMPRYCVKCGAPIDSGYCPNCEGVAGETLVMVSPPAVRTVWYLHALNGQVAGQVYEISSGRQIRFGRGAGNEIDLREGDVSHQHAALRVSAEGVWIEDLGSRNGTFVNGVRLREPVLLNEGDLIQIAHLHFRLAKGVPQPNVATMPEQEMVVQRGRPHNGQWTVFYGWLVFTLIAIVGCFVPTLLGMDMMNGGFALITVSLFLAIVGLVCAGFYLHRALTLDKVFKNLLVHWRYSPQEWQSFTEADYRKTRFEKVPLFVLMLIISVVIGGFFVIIDPEAGIWVLGFLMLVMLFIGVLVVLLPVLRRARRGKVGDVYIGDKGLCLNGEFHNWNSLGGRLDRVRILPGELLVMDFEYSYWTRTGREHWHVRVPVPKGEEPAAHRLEAYFNCRASD